MQFYPQKCHTMHITNKRNIIQSTYTIHNHNLQTTNTSKYLGIHIHSTLNWNTHINKTVQRANTTSAFVHTNICTCPRKTKHLAYTTLVRPILEYAIIIWDPHTNIQPPPFTNMKQATNMKQDNAAQPGTSCTTTVDMLASQPCSNT